MPNYHELEKDARKAGSDTTDEELKPKKPFQTVGRPATTDHNMHDDFVKNPPQNLSGGTFMGNTTNPGKKEGAYEREPTQIGVLGHEETGRIKHADAQAEMVNQSSVHP
ncbi:hypothetical protein HYDPIDRAFT_154365 [Hydnomerulius pinastri MD-312]|uniref:Uncharacterized protein n=1 Tax=Hydnomerulius pinastri MD-312 TaxID=994086 RepID=A0A0C9VGC8_9AGAM|nr:hypothetical protein HYDPIDRAFT_154365 [Hydnomerulius pinastri MD-312]